MYLYFFACHYSKCLCFVGTKSHRNLLNQSMHWWSYDPMSHTCATEPLELWYIKTFGKAWPRSKSMQSLSKSTGDLQYFQVVFWLPGNKSSLQIGAQKTFGNGDICDRAINSYFSYIGKEFWRAGQLRAVIALKKLRCKFPCFSFNILSLISNYKAVTAIMQVWDLNNVTLVSVFFLNDWYICFLS